MHRDEIVADSYPNPHFSKPPYRAELFSRETGCAGVMNVQGINVLGFRSKPGAVLTDYETAKAIAAKWNG